jgi:hypothetical protein
MALVLKSVFNFEETWIECLGDLARYRIVVDGSSDGIGSQLRLDMD